MTLGKPYLRLTDESVVISQHWPFIQILLNLSQLSLILDSGIHDTHNVQVSNCHIVRNSNPKTQIITAQTLISTIFYKDVPPQTLLSRKIENHFAPTKKNCKRTCACRVSIFQTFERTKVLETVVHANFKQSRLKFEVHHLTDYQEGYGTDLQSPQQ